jgi:hypothetical protein
MVSLLALTWLGAVDVLERTERSRGAMSTEGEEGHARAELERFCQEAWERLRALAPMAMRDAESADGVVAQVHHLSEGLE